MTKLRDRSQMVLTLHVTLTINKHFWTRGLERTCHKKLGVAEKILASFQDFFETLSKLQQTNFLYFYTLNYYSVVMDLLK